MSSELTIIRAADPEALFAEIDRIVRFVDRNPDVRLLDIAYTAALKTKGAEVLAVVAENAADLRARLVSARSRLASGMQRIRDKSGTYYLKEHLLGGPDGGRLAFVFPGVMSFYPDMLRDLAITYPECRSAFDELEEAMRENEEFAPADFIFPPAPYYRHDADIFGSGAYAPALVASYAASAALSRLLRSQGVVPDALVGFAGGDLASFVRSGAFGENPSRGDRLKMLAEVYKIVDKAIEHAGLPEAGMISVLTRVQGDELKVIEELGREHFELSIDLSPRQKIYAVDAETVETAIAAFAAAGIRTLRLELKRPFHTSRCEKLVPVVRRVVDFLVRRPPQMNIYSCTTAARIEGPAQSLRDAVALSWAKPIKFAQTIERMYEDGVRVFLEVGPRGMMTAAIEDTLKGRPHAAIALNSIHRRGELQLQHALGTFAAIGGTLDSAPVLRRRGAEELDFDAAFARTARRETELRLSRAFPKLTLLSSEDALKDLAAAPATGARNARAVQRAAAVAAAARRNRQFGFGAMSPLVSDADVVSETPGVSVTLKKVFKLDEDPFIVDSAIGSGQLSYSDPNLRPLVMLTMPVAAEIMAEVAMRISPNRRLGEIGGFNCQRAMAFAHGEMPLIITGERVPSRNPSEIAVRVFLREDREGDEYVRPAMEATFVMVAGSAKPRAVRFSPMEKPRTVHWSGRDIYPFKLCAGKRLRGIRFAETWSETGLDYEVEVPPLAGHVTHTRFPMWAVNPVLLEIVISGFSLWRGHERFAGAYSFPFKIRKLEFAAPLPAEGAHLKCYLRLVGVTPQSHIADIDVTDGNGVAVMSIGGLEAITERINPEYRALVMSPVSSFVTAEFPDEAMGSPSTDVASAFVTDVPYPIFRRFSELWLKVFSHIVLSGRERQDFREMPGTVERRVEWLFGRLAAKEAVRRFLKKFYQARWSDADIVIMTDMNGKPYAIGEWNDFLPAKIDIAIAHTANFIVALAAANARVGVDVESAERDLSEEFTSGVFTPEELELAANAVNSAQAVIRFWCAKEAVSKALGTGIRYSPREMTVVSYQPDAGTLAIRLEGAWLQAFRKFKGRDIAVTVRNLSGHALAFCFIPLSLLDEN